MPFISAEDLIQGYPNIQPETVNLIRWFYSQFNNRSAANKNIVNVEPFYYQGVNTGSELLTYAPTKLYLCISLGISLPAATTATQNYSQLMNEANVLSFNINLNIPYWDTTAAGLKLINNTVFIQNIYFSRLNPVTASVIYFYFNGYRITLI